MSLDAPFHVDDRGRTAGVTPEQQLKNLLEQLLFTSLGERVNRPEFGGGVRPLVFAGNSPELAAALQFNLRANLQRYLGDAIDVRDLIVTPNDAVLTIEIKYRDARSPQEQVARFERQV